MKALYKFYISTALGCLGLAVQAQTAYNAGTVMQEQLSGTARFVGMGGAMSALGGDLSVMGTNPAGIGLYRRNDVAVTFGWYGQSAKSNYNGQSAGDDVSRFSFDQAGFVYSSKIGDHTSMRYFNIGFNYRKQQNFYSNMYMEGAVNGESYSQNIAAALTLAGSGGYGLSSYTANDFNKLLSGNMNPYYDDDRFGWMSVMAGLTGLVNGYVDENGVSVYEGWGSNWNSFRSKNSGGIHAFDFNISTNIEDRWYLGLTIGVYDVDFRRYSSYVEEVYSYASDAQPGADPDYAGVMQLENWYNTEGSGVDIKLGVIWRPFEYSPFRIGLAIHTPTWYNLRDTYSARMTMFDVNGNGIMADTRDGGYGDTSYDYELRTPWKFNLSAGYTFGQHIAVGAEYEYADYSSTDARDPKGWDLSALNEEIESSLEGMHTFRIGMEANVFDDICLRVGYNYQSALYSKGAYKFNDPQGTRTDIDYENMYGAHNITAGLGFRFGRFYADLAYVYTHQKADFYPYSNLIFDEADPVARMTYTNNRGLLTLGYKF